MHSFSWFPLTPQIKKTALFLKGVSGGTSCLVAAKWHRKKRVTVVSVQLKLTEGLSGSYLIDEATGSGYFGQKAFFVLHHPGHALLVLQSLLPFNFHVTDLQQKMKKANYYILDTHMAVLNFLDLCI